MKKRKKPNFHKQKSHSLKRIAGKGWRTPRGCDSKQRRKKKSRGARPKAGYCQPKKIRHLHPSGFKEVLVRNVSELEGIDSKTHAVRIAAPVGKRKRADIAKICAEKKLKMLNK
jgi:large subunit ribosomal protein L32e